MAVYTAMNFKLLPIVLATVVSVSHASARQGPDAAAIKEQRLRDRETQRASAMLVLGESIISSAATDSDVLTALGLTSTVATAVTRAGSGQAFATFSSLGAIKPVTGTKFLAISTGVAGTTSPEPGTDFSPSGTSGDLASVSLTINVPAGTRRLSFFYRYMSAEFPEYVGSQFDDRFSASIVSGGSTRQIATANVNSAHFVPASSANAGGSGYDIGSSSPDAGLTEWTPVAADVTPNTTITLTFSVQDVGDGIYDSQVLISALTLGGVETLDPIPELLTTTGLTTDLERLASDLRPVRGAAADGVTRLLLRVSPGDAKHVTLALLNATAADGTLTTVAGSAGTSTLVVPVVNTLKGPRAFAFYVAPPDFAKSGVLEPQERTVTLRVSYTSAAGQETTSEVPIVIARPPLMFIHGLWSAGKGKYDAWAAQPLLNDPRFAGRTNVVDYETTNAEAFATNLPRFQNWISTTKKLLTSRQLAVTQVDVVAHSMGGVLTRAYAAKPTGYLRPDNYGDGDVNRLITLNSPHTGSPLADLLVTLRTSSVGQQANYLFTSGDMPLGAAIDDLREHSSALNGIGALTVPSHALAGTGGSDAVDVAEVAGSIAELASDVPLPPQLTTLFKAMSFIAEIIGISNTVIFGDRKHDLIVPLDSELGGLPVAATTTLTGLSTIHTFVTADSGYASRIAQLLDTPAASSTFGRFPAAGGSSLIAGQEIQKPIVDHAVVAPPQKITLAASGSTTVTAGTTVTFTATPHAGVTLSRVIVMGPAVAQTDSSSPFQVQITVPAGYLGPFAVTAFGVDTASQLVGSNTVTLQIGTSATLQQIAVQPGSVLLTALGTSYSLTATGTYSDSVVRQLSGTGLLTFTSSNTEVATVSADGTVTAVAPGYSTITAARGSLQTSVSITVNPLANEPPPTAEAGPDLAVTPSTPVTLTGTAAGVPAGVTASYAWNQVSGPAVSVTGAATATAKFTPTTAGTYVFSLVVRAGLSESVPDNVTVVVGAASAPQIAAQPQSVTAGKGESALFTVVATGIPTPAYVWRKGGVAIAGATGSSLALTNLQAADAGVYSVVVSNASGSVTSADVTLTVTGAALPVMAIDKPALQFAAVTTGTAFSSKTSNQIVRLTQSGSGTVSWTAVSSQPWLTVSPASGTGAASLSIGVQYVEGLGASAAGTITISFTGAANTLQAIDATLAVATGSSAAPTGVVDTPIDGLTGVAGSLAVTGWAVDDLQVERVTICRDPVAGESVGAEALCNGRPMLYIGDGVFVDGARPDVQATFPNTPLNSRAGWGYLMLTNFLPNRGNGTFTLHAFASDGDGHTTPLGSKTITCANAASTAPFGAIDTPAQGEVISGTYNNFGWVLSPGSARADVAGGGSVQVFIDGVNRGTPVGWVSRSDLVSLFPAAEYSGVQNSAAVFTFDSTAFSNGVHSIAWLVTDTAGGASGVGSRYFSISNNSLVAGPGGNSAAGIAPPDVIQAHATLDIPHGAALRTATTPLAEALTAVAADVTPIEGRRGFDPAATTREYAVTDGRFIVESEELDRVEIRLGHGAAGRYTGYLRTVSGLAPLPVGSTLDAVTGQFSWMPVPGFLGAYDLVFVRWNGSGPAARQEVRVVLNPQGTSRR